MALTEVFLYVGSLDAASRRDHSEPAIETTRRSLVDVAGFIADRQVIYRTMLDEGRNPFYAAVEDAFTDRTIDTLNQMTDLPDWVDVELAARFVASGSVGVISWWLRTPGTRTVDDLGHQLAELIPAWFTRDR